MKAILFIILTALITITLAINCVGGTEGYTPVTPDTNEAPVS